MKGFIHIAIRRNLIYIVNLIIHYYLRKVVLIIINNKYDFNDSLIFTFLMLSGEFFGGLAIYLYRLHFFKKLEAEKKEFKNDLSNKEKLNKNHLVLDLIHEKAKFKKHDNSFKIGLLIFFSAFFDFVEFVIATFYIPRFSIVSPTSEYRFGGFIIVLGALICHYNLKIRILKHQFYSLLIIGISLIIIIALEIIYRGKGVSFGDFCFAHMLVIGYLLFVPFTDIIEKYLIEFDFINPFVILMVEAIIGFILIFIYSSGIDPFKDIKRLYIECSGGDFVLFIFLLFLYFTFSAGANIYKILTNGLYSPMAKTLAAYILNPLIYIYYFGIGIDFLTDGERNWFYFLVNIFKAVIISFSGCIFNEFLVLTCFGLDYETHSSISSRAIDNLIDIDNTTTLTDMETISEG